MAVTARSGLTLASPAGWLLILTVFSVPAAAAESAAGNPHLQSALNLFHDVEYEEALQALEQAKQWPSNTLTDRISIALLEGVLAYETQQSDRGDSAFQWALEHDRQAKLIILVSPKVAARLEELRERLPPASSGPLAESVPERRMNLQLPVALGGGVVAVGGLLAWGKGKSLEWKVRRADPSIDSGTRLKDTLQQGKTFNKVGWILMGLGAATAASSLLFFDTPTTGATGTIAPMAQGAQVSIFWRLP